MMNKRNVWRALGNVVGTAKAECPPHDGPRFAIIHSRRLCSRGLTHVIDRLSCYRFA